MREKLGKVGKGEGKVVEKWEREINKTATGFLQSCKESKCFSSFCEEALLEAIPTNRQPCCRPWDLKPFADP